MPRNMDIAEGTLKALALVLLLIVSVPTGGCAATSAADGSAAQSNKGEPTTDADAIAATVQLFWFSCWSLDAPKVAEYLAPQEGWTPELAIRHVTVRKCKHQMSNSLEHVVFLVRTVEQLDASRAVVTGDVFLRHGGTISDWALLYPGYQLSVVRIADRWRVCFDTQAQRAE